MRFPYRSRPRRRRPLLRAALPALVALTCAGLTTGCPAAGDDVRPPRAQLVFPSGMAVSPDESVMFVANANSDLRYDSGSVVPVDLGQVDAILDDWLGSDTIPSDCVGDAQRPTILECNERVAIDGDAGVRIGNFSTELRIQQMASGDMRVIAAVRGDPSVTWIDYPADSRELSCVGSEEVPLCDSDNRLIYLRDDVELPELSAEPFGVYVDSQNEYALITHLRLSAVTLVDLPGTLDRPPMLADAIGGLFSVDPVTAVSSAVGAAGRRPGTPGDLVYVTSRTEDKIQLFHIDRRAGSDGERELPVLVPSEYFFLDGVSPSDDSRGITFSPTGDRAYIVNRSPAALHIIDTRDGVDGFPDNSSLGFVELCRDPSNIVAADVGRGERVYVSCFLAGQVWVIDPASPGAPEAIIDVGRGPFAVAMAAARKRLYVANFLEDTIAVIDLAPGAPTENQMVLRLGQPRQSGEDE